TLEWVDRNGAAEPLKALPRAYRLPRLSPDGQQVALIIAERINNIWIYSLARDTTNRLTFGGTSGSFIWTRDGKRVVFATGESRPSNLFWKAADGSGEEERLTTGNNSHQPGSFTLDGRILLSLDINSAIL